MQETGWAGGSSGICADTYMSTTNELNAALKSIRDSQNPDINKEGKCVLDLQKNEDNGANKYYKYLSYHYQKLHFDLHQIKYLSQLFAGLPEYKLTLEQVVI